MKKLLLVEVPDKYHLSVASIAAFKVEWDGTKETFCKFTEIPVPTKDEIDYLLTLHNHNEGGKLFAPVPEGIETKLRQ